MRLKALIILAVLLAAPARAHAMFGADSFLAGVWYTKDMAYQSFRKLKVIEEIRIMKQNYDSSMRYYQMFKQMNSGQGLLHNVKTRLKVAGDQMAYDLEAQIDRDFIHTYNTDTKVDKFFQGIDQKIYRNMRYTGDGLAKLIQKADTGVRISENASGLSPKDAANLSVKAQGLQFQMMVQLHEDNLRLIELQTMHLAVEMRKEKERLEMIQKLRESVQRRVPGASGAGSDSETAAASPWWSRP
ncbi:MAG: hypothetical protein ABIJ96_01615 [Elusimicrobiota bacterium]